MKKKILFTLIIVSLFQLLIKSQTQQINIDTALTYYPLNIGNKWVFDETATSTIPPIITIQRVWSLEIIGDTLMPNNENYFTVQQIMYDDVLTLSLSFERIDSVNTRVLKYDAEFDTSNFEILTLDLSVELFGTFYTPYCEAFFAEIGSISRFGQMFDYRGYYYTCGLFYPTYYYLKSIGLYKYNWYADFVESSSTLRGCTVNGVVYGDTTTVSVDDEDLPQPDYFLYQNYPNPFNPTTKIKFRVPSVTLRQAQSDILVTLKVFDVLGNEVATLVNEEKPAGEYEVEFSVGQDSSPDIASGIYFYQLKAANYTETKKMILLK
jgi:hypothetical protein